MTQKTENFKDLQTVEWQAEYVDYQELSDFIVSIDISTNLHDDQVESEIQLILKDTTKMNYVYDTKKFLDLLETQISKVSAFFLSKEVEFTFENQQLQEKIQMINLNSKKALTSKTVLAESFSENLHKLTLLKKYREVNYSVIVDLVKQFDLRTGNSITKSYLERVRSLPFYTSKVIKTLQKDTRVRLTLIFFYDCNYPYVGNCNTCVV